MLILIKPCDHDPVKVEIVQAGATKVEFWMEGVFELFETFLDEGGVNHMRKVELVFKEKV